MRVTARASTRRWSEEFFFFENFRFLAWWGERQRKEREREKLKKPDAFQFLLLFELPPFYVKSIIRLGKKSKATESYTKREERKTTTKKKKKRRRGTVPFFSLSREQNAEKKEKILFHSLSLLSPSPSLLHSLSAVSSTSTSSPLWYASIMMSHPPKKLPAMYTCGKVGQAFFFFFFEVEKKKMKRKVSFFSLPPFFCFHFQSSPPPLKQKNSRYAAQRSNKGGVFRNEEKDEKTKKRNSQSTP